MFPPPDFELVSRVQEYLAPPAIELPRKSANMIGRWVYFLFGLLPRGSLGMDLVHDQPRDAGDDNDHKDREHDAPVGVHIERHGAAIAHSQPPGPPGPRQVRPLSSTSGPACIYSEGGWIASCLALARWLMARAARSGSNGPIVFGLQSE